MLEFRRAKPQDAIVISRIYAAAWKKAYIGMVPQEFLDTLPENHWVDAFYEWIKADRFRADLLYEGETPVGAVSYGRSSEKMCEGVAEIQSIYVHPDFQKRGFGRMLLEKAMNELRALSYQSCYVWVLDENINAQEFYKHLGFLPTEETVVVKIMDKNLTDFKYTKGL